MVGISLLLFLDYHRVSACPGGTVPLGHARQRLDQRLPQSAVHRPEEGPAVSHGLLELPRAHERHVGGSRDGLAVDLPLGVELDVGERVVGHQALREVGAGHKCLEVDPAVVGIPRIRGELLPHQREAGHAAALPQAGVALRLARGHLEEVRVRPAMLEDLAGLEGALHRHGSSLDGEREVERGERDAELLLALRGDLENAPSGMAREVGAMQGGDAAALLGGREPRISLEVDADGMDEGRPVKGLVDISLYHCILLSIYSWAPTIKSVARAVSAVCAMRFPRMRRKQALHALPDKPASACTHHLRHLAGGGSL